MWYSVDFNKLALNFQLIALRKPKMMAWLYSFIKPLVTSNYNFVLFKKETDYKIAHNWQTCYMRGALNDKFDTELRRIYIGNGVLYNTTYVYTEPEAQELYMHTEAEADTIWVYTEAETGDTGVNFIVYVPASIVQTQIHELRAEIEFYKLGGMKYLIIEIEG
ncbi:MAG TPA: hypothetical protein DHV22_08105 [Xanthomarina gelatinilytica]|uniref:Uncharacterized protein n=1 Tax=Xanthomarina gelatinilytica TaxID=1137281 RepID=A0A3D6BQN1_9FLAO|nr:hypothetical protein [Xanthomarina gelatinilytica]